MSVQLYRKLMRILETTEENRRHPLHAEIQEIASEHHFVICDDRGLVLATALWNPENPDESAAVVAKQLTLNGDLPEAMKRDFYGESSG